MDVWRLLESANAAGLSAETWALQGAKLDAARILHPRFAAPQGRGPTAATRDARDQLRIRALVAKVVARPDQ